MSNKNFRVTIEIELSPKHVWPDDNDDDYPRPTRPTSMDVKRTILASTTSMQEWFEEWNLSYGAKVTISDQVYAQDGKLYKAKLTQKDWEDK